METGFQTHHFYLATRKKEDACWLDKGRKSRGFGLQKG